MIQKLFVVDKVIKITRIEVGGVNPSEVQYISEPSKFACYSLFLSLKVYSLSGGREGSVSALFSGRRVSRPLLNALYTDFLFLCLQPNISDTENAV